MVRFDGKACTPSVGGVVALQVIEVREVQPQKALYSMLVTPLPRVTEVREVQPVKVSYPMLVTLLGMVIEAREVHSSKA